MDDIVIRINLGSSKPIKVMTCVHSCHTQFDRRNRFVVGIQLSSFAVLVCIAAILITSCNTYHGDRKITYDLDHVNHIRARKATQQSNTVSEVLFQDFRIFEK